MSILKTFPMGGIYPREMKEATRDKPVWNASVPVVSIVPLLQHLGTPAECLVGPGDTVREGMLIGRSSGHAGSQIHSPVPGTVRELREIHLSGGRKSPAVVIDMGGEFDRLGKSARVYPWVDVPRKQLLAIIADKGVVGMGSGLPTHLKLSIPRGRRAEILIINGAECEPYITADHRIMVEKAAELAEGARVAAKILECSRIVIAVQAEKKEALEAVERAAETAGSRAEIMALRSKFPQGDEKLLIKAVTGREVPSGGSSLDTGAVVINIGTLFSLYEAVVLQKPVIDRVLTVAGGAIRNPGNLKVRIGTPLSDLIEECGGFVEEPEKIVIGGPMMGNTVYDPATPVTKITSGVLFLTSREIRNSRRTNCLNCGRCIACCPMGLDPAALHKWVDHADFEVAFRAGILDCRECGCCGYVCPARIPLVQGLRVGKLFLSRRKVDA